MSKTPKTKSEKPEYPLGVTEAQVKKWKAQHGEVHLVEVPLDDEQVAYGYFKRPSLEVMSATAKFSESDPVKSTLILYEGCKLKADTLLNESDEAKMAAATKVSRLFKRRTAAIKKL